MTRSAKVLSCSFATFALLSFSVAAQDRAPTKAPTAQDPAPAKAQEAPAPADRSSLEAWEPGLTLEKKPTYWETAKGPVALGKQQFLNRMRLFNQNAKWENLDKLSAAAITYDDKDLLAFGHFYRAILAGRAKTLDDAMQHLRLALKFGYRNPDDILAAEPLADLQTRDDFKAMIKELAERLDREMHERFEAYVNASLDAEKFSTTPWMPDLKATSGAAVFSPGAPSVAILTRLYHDGFPKALAVVEGVRAARSDKLPLTVLFYQYDAEDPTGQKIAKRYAESLGLEIPWAIIGRDAYKALTGALAARDVAIRPFLLKQAGAVDPNDPTFLPAAFNYFPVTIFFDGDGAPRLALEAVPDVWQAEYAFDRFAAAIGTDAPPKEGPAPVESPAPPGEVAPVESE